MGRSPIAIGGRLSVSVLRIIEEYIKSSENVIVSYLLTTDT